MMTPEQKAFLMEEFKDLRSRVAQAVQDARKLEYNVLIASGVIFTWLLTHSSSSASISMPSWAWWIPFFMIVCGVLRAFMIYNEIKMLVKYAIQQEEVFLGTTGGWEKFIKTKQTQLSRAAAALFVWGALALGTLMVAVWKTWYSE